jgi:hypothetical protein
VVAVVAVVASAVVAGLWPIEWLQLGGASTTAFGAALVLALIGLAPESALAQALARGLPLELGRSAYPLLLVHLPVYALIQAAVPGVRPAALLFVGGSWAWLISLLLHDGLLQRIRLVRQLAGLGIAAVLLAVLGDSARLQAHAEPAASAAVTRPMVLVLGGVTGHQLAAILKRTSTDLRVVDGTRPACGLLAAGAPDAARVRATAGLPIAASPCLDWRRYWREQIGTVRPDLLLVDLAADALPVPASGGEGACDAVFRQRYRALLNEATGVWTADAPTRAVLLASAPVHGDDPASSAARCLNLLLTEAVAGRAALVGLDTERLLCPGRTCRPAGYPDGPAGGGDVDNRPGEGDQVGLHLEAALERELARDRAEERSAELAACRPASGSGIDDVDC